MRDIVLVDAFQLRQLHLAIDARHFPHGSRVGRGDGHAIGDGLRDDIGQIVFPLRIVVRQGRQPLFELHGGRDHDAAVDLLDGALFWRGILFLDDAHDGAVLAHDAAQAEGIVLFHGQDGQLVLAGGLHQLLQGGGAGQRHVAVQDQGRYAVIEQGHGLLHRMAGTQLLRLLGSVDRQGMAGLVAVEQLQHGGAPMPVNHA